MLKIRAVNPSETERQKVEIKSFLPARVDTQAVVNLGGLDLGYDVNRGLHFVHKEVELDPKEVRTFEVELKDIWIIPETEMEDLRAHARRLVDMLKATAYVQTAEQLWTAIDGALSSMKDRQSRNSIDLAKPIDHMRAYEVNLQALARVREDVGSLENLVIGSGGDPGQLLGAAKGGQNLSLASPIATNAETVAIKIQVHNPSTTSKRVLSVRRDLPAEVGLDDVLDPGMLQVGYAADTKRTYVYLDNVELAPEETKLFEVRVRDRWRLDPSRIVSLESRATNVLGVIRQAGGLKSVEDAVSAIVGELKALSGIAGGGTISAEYVAAYRENSRRLDAIESKIMRLEDLIKSQQNPKTFLTEAGRIFRVAAPEKKTTWIIIYSILGFLGVVSLLFFLRWYGRPKGERGESG